MVSQLAPGLRLVAPAMAGAIGIPALVYFPFAVSGMAIWNLSFVATGHFAAQHSPQVQTASIAAIVIGAFVAIQLLGVCAWWAWRRLRRMETTPDSSRGTQARVAGQ